MPLVPLAYHISQTSYTNAHFGGNFLATRDMLGDTGTFDEAVNALNIQTLRYPGGALTEYSQGVITADTTTATSPATGEEFQFTSIGDLTTYAEAEGIPVTYVLPTRVFLSEETDEDGNRFAEVDEPALREFLQGVMDGTFSASPDIQAFEIGNEYWGSGDMNTVEYSRVATEIVRIVDDELASHPDADRFEETDILVQMAQNYGRADLSNTFIGSPQEQLAAVNETFGLSLSEDRYIYSSGDLAWAKIQNEILVDRFSENGTMNAIDGVVAHIYSKGDETPNSRYFELSQIKDTWLTESPGLDIYATEWNLKRTIDDTREEEYGLKQAHEMLNLAEAFTWGGVDAAHVWPVQSDGRSGLTNAEGSEDVRVPGEMFRLMQETLPGTRPLSLQGGETRETELKGDTADLHVFHADDRMVTYLASTSDETQEQVIDFSNLVTSTGEVEITRLGVRDGENPTAANATPVVTDEDPDSLIEDGILLADLAPREIMVIEMLNPDYTDAVNSAAAPADPELPWVEMPADDSSDSDDADNAVLAALQDAGGGLGAIGLGLLPLLLLAL